MNYKQEWLEVYCSSINIPDPHQAFATLIGVSRDEAKVICYKIMFQIPFLTKTLVGLRPKQYRKAHQCK